MTELTIDDALIIIGAKEVELFQERKRIAQAMDLMKMQAARIAEFEKNAKDLEPDAKSVPDEVK